MPHSVAELCREKAISLQELLDRSGLDETRVQAIVLGRWTPSPEERRRIADALGSTVDDIAWGHVTPIQHLYGHGPG
jgi:transcriptional regulator with XRE-family HTH domain